MWSVEGMVGNSRPSGMLGTRGPCLNASSTRRGAISIKLAARAPWPRLGATGVADTGLTSHTMVRQGSGRGYNGKAPRNLAPPNFIDAHLGRYSSISQLKKSSTREGMSPLVYFFVSRR